MKIKNWVLGILTLGLFIGGISLIWVSTLKLPDFSLFYERKIQSSTKIYDRTGEFLLYDVHQDIKRTIVPYEDINLHVKNAAVAIEDSEFYNHKGIRIKAILRAIWVNFKGNSLTQGGSTITQQTIKGTLLIKEKTISRKIKEWILAIKLEKVMNKEEILTLYLNESPYGGNIYGVKEATKAFFGKNPDKVTLAEAAYLAAIPNAPTYYSPYRKNKDKLDARKNLVLKRMRKLDFITEEEYQKALKEQVEFLPEQKGSISAPHFVFFIKEYLQNRYGQDALENGGMKVITTLDYELQKKAEEIAKEKALENEKKFDGENIAIVVINPKTGQILSMVGSRDYFDPEIDGNFNVATALRQPGSSFKPIVYATAFKKGYTADTVLFDVPTEFSTSCNENSVPLRNNKIEDCYNPDNYDNKFRGPLSLREALAQSINVVAVKLLYLVGLDDALKTARDLGITTLNDQNRFGLTLVIGGGETTLLEMTSAYGVFATEGVKHSPQSILKIENDKGEILEEYEEKSYQVIEPNATRILSDILSDNIARIPTFGAYSNLVIPGVEVAAKTGTTNDNRDAWMIGYTPSVVVGVWAGNNDNTPMKKGGSAVAGPAWNALMKEVLKELPKNEYFNQPSTIDLSISPTLRGFWQGGETFVIDKISGGLATEYTPLGTREEKSITNVHSILHWIDKDKPLSIKPEDPTINSLYTRFEYGVQSWWNSNKYNYQIITELNKPNYYDNIHNKKTKPSFELNGLLSSYKKDQSINITVVGSSLINKIDFFVNDIYIKSLKIPPFNFSFSPSSISNISEKNILKIISYDAFGNKKQKLFYFNIK